jgi:hypothetical protein
MLLVPDLVPVALRTAPRRERMGAGVVDELLPTTNNESKSHDTPRRVVATRRWTGEHTINVEEGKLNGNAQKIALNGVITLWWGRGERHIDCKHR